MKTILVCGHGTGISDAVARRFGREGHAVGLVARSRDRLVAAAEAISAAGATAKAFPCDLGDPAAVRAMVREAHAALGPIGVIHWNAYKGGGGDLLTATPDEIRGAFDVSVQGLVAAVQEALPDLRSEKGAVLVTGGGFGLHVPQIDAICVQNGVASLAIAKSAQHKVVGMLHLALAPQGVYVGEVMVLGTVKGTAFDRGQGGFDAADIANKFWDLAQARDQTTFDFK